MDSIYEDRWSWCTESFKDQRDKEIEKCPVSLIFIPQITSAHYILVI